VSLLLVIGSGSRDDGEKECVRFDESSEENGMFSASNPRVEMYEGGSSVD
jgi:hypothetical protein